MKFGAVNSGSPPHVRELRLIGYKGQKLTGITPACAGTTKENDTLTARQRDHPRMCGNYKVLPAGDYDFTDHPRMCGNYAIDSAGKAEKLGSPPHVRELHYSLWSFPSLAGITPACAGTTQTLMRESRLEKGSPPHVRELRH